MSCASIFFLLPVCSMSMLKSPVMIDFDVGGHDVNVLSIRLDMSLIGAPRLIYALVIQIAWTRCNRSIVNDSK